MSSPACPLPAREDLIRRTGSAPDGWALRVREVCEHLADVFAELGVPVRLQEGAFTGVTRPGALFHQRRGTALHTWLLLPCGQVADPARYAFTGEPSWPLWVGDPADYDPVSAAGPARRPPRPRQGERRWLLKLGRDDRDYLTVLLDGDERDQTPAGVMITAAQAGWLAGLPVQDTAMPGTLAAAPAPAVRRALIDSGFRSLLPHEPVAEIRDAA